MSIENFSSFLHLANFNLGPINLQTTRHILETSQIRHVFLVKYREMGLCLGRRRFDTEDK